MKRREFLAVAGAAAGSAAISNVPTVAAQAATPRRTFGAGRAVVVGAGAFGGWTALHLIEQGFDVTLVDAYGPGSARATSGDETRGLRYAYGRRDVYTRLAVDARKRWMERQEDWGVTIALPAGRLSMAPEVTASMQDAQAIFDRRGLPYEYLDAAEIRYRWPQFGPDGLAMAMYEPDALALRANLACRVVADTVTRQGGRVIIGKVQAPASTGPISSVMLGNGETLNADVFVFACGAWLPRLFPELLGDRIRVVRRDVLLFGPPAGDARFSYPNLPNWTESGQRTYGFPDVFGAGFKVAPSGGNETFNPDTDERFPSGESIARARAYLALRFPDMAKQPLVHYRVCQLENTADEHFLIDRHPEMENVWIAGGGSGHAFKHGPALGNYIARRVNGEDPDAELTRLWHLNV
ncbi:MAG TPA: FAD-dependent oxidoreductase [Gemmatimonadales bacterium]|nr:FAD-dependent oxidoreductase [Gemmatimonadales bacterium]